MKVLGVLPVSIGGRLTTSSILDGFRLLGCEVVTYDELRDNYKLENDCDLIVGYDFSPVKLKKDFGLNMKCVSYFSDEIRNRTSGPYWQELLPELDKKDNYVFYWDRELVKQENFHNLFYLPHFVNTNIYKPFDTNSSIGSSVMFAGRLDTDYRLDMIVDIAETLDIDFQWYAIERHYKDALNRVKNKSTIERIYRGFIDNEKDMAAAINQADIVINMNSQGVSSLNYRTMQAIACGTLLISDEREELDLFNNKVPVYKDKACLKELISYYLAHNEERKNIAETCRQIVIENHNSLKGVSYMLSKVL